jgi:fatty acid synthase subunit alpha, fungi type
VYVAIKTCFVVRSLTHMHIPAYYFPMKPHTSVSDDGKVRYSEIPRYYDDFAGYVEFLESVGLSSETGSSHFEFIDRLESSTLPSSFTDKEREVIERFLEFSKKSDSLIESPFVEIKRRSDTDQNIWISDPSATALYFDAMKQQAGPGVSFSGKYMLMTGCGQGSIGISILKNLLLGGANVIVTTSRFSKKVAALYQSVYQQHGAKGSSLIVVPFNAGSVRDTKALVDYIYRSASQKGLGWDLDFILPFAAIPEQGREIDSIDGRSELAHRIMLTNLVRLLGYVKVAKQTQGIDTRPAAVILPLSPNHGTFGGDGLYGESKIALETLLNRFHSENWGLYLTMIGAVIGYAIDVFYV